MSVTTEEALQRARNANDLDAVAELEALLKYESEIDVAPYFYDQMTQPETPAFIGVMDQVGDFGSGLINPVTLGAGLGGSNAAYNALIKERGITLPKEEGEKKGKKISGDEARNRMTQARAKGQGEFEKVRDANVDKLQKEYSDKTRQFGATINSLQNEVTNLDNDIKTTNALTSQALSRGDTLGADANQAQSDDLGRRRDEKLNELNKAQSQVSSAENRLNSAKNSQMSVAQSVDIDSQVLQQMGIDPPDVTKELQSGDLDGARKKMSDVLEKNLQSKSAWMKSAVDYMKQNPGKAIPRALGKVGKATFTGDSFKKSLLGGVAGGLVAGVGKGIYDAYSGDYLSDEEAAEERQKFIELGRLAEKYRNTSRGSESMYLNPLVPEQKQVIDQLREGYEDPSRAYLLYRANEQ